MSTLKIKAFRVNQNKQGFLLGIFKMSELRRFVKFTSRIVIDYDEETNKPIYNNEVQRKISPAKVDSIADFLIFDNDAFFPTNIVISVPIIAINNINDIDEFTTEIILNDFVETETRKEDGDIYLTIIDGQHRVAGIEKAIKRIKDEINNLEYSIRTSSTNLDRFEGELIRNKILLDQLENFEIVVTFFVDPTLPYQAMVFSTINRTQTRVSEDLVYSLFGLNKSDSPQKTSLEVILALNATTSSPLYNRIKISGADYKRKSLPPLSQAMAVKMVLFNICPNLKQAEIEKNLSRKDLKFNYHEVFLPFRKYYITNDDLIIAQIINVYFKAVRDTFKNPSGYSYWDLESTFNILHTTVGFQALFGILIEILKISKEEQRKDYEYFVSFLSKAQKIDFEDKNEPKQFPLTSKSINLLYNKIGNLIFEKFTPRQVKD